MKRSFVSLALCTAAFAAIASDAVVQTATQDRLLVDDAGHVVAAREVDVFGGSLFKRDSVKSGRGTFNPDYVLSVGDVVSVRVWGAVTYEGKYTIDAQGNVFLPSIGPVRVEGVHNAQLNTVFEQAAKTVFKSNVFVYANLEAAQAVKVFVTGAVRRPGLYEGVSSESVLSFLASAGGIDVERGSFVNVVIKRSGSVRAKINLYSFLVDGSLPLVQFADGDVVLVEDRAAQVVVEGDVANAAKFEFVGDEVAAEKVFAMAKPRSGATNFSVRRLSEGVDSVERYRLADAASVTLRAGDKVWVNTEASKNSIGVSVSFGDGTSRVLVAGVGQTLSSLLKSLPKTPNMDYGSVQLMRRSVAERQQKMLETTLNRLESVAFTTPSATQEEALIRSKEAEMVSKFVERARKVKPIGQVVLGSNAMSSEVKLEDGDVLVVPQVTSLVSVQGEVQFPSTMVYQAGMDAKDYIENAGGMSKAADTSSVFVMRRSGAVSRDLSSIVAGDEIFVMPKVDSKNLEAVKAISQVIYQIAVSAKVILGL